MKRLGFEFLDALDKDGYQLRVVDGEIAVVVLVHEVGVYLPQLLRHKPEVRLLVDRVLPFPRHLAAIPFRGSVGFHHARVVPIGNPLSERT